jgi:hypothetical protein
MNGILLYYKHTRTRTHAHTHTHTHTCCLQIMLPVLLIKITWGQRKYMQVTSNLVSEWIKQKPYTVIYGHSIHLHRLVKWKAVA